MRTLVLFTVVFLQVLHISKSEIISMDGDIVACIPHRNPRFEVLEEYSKLGVVIDLHNVSIRHIAVRKIISEFNVNYNQFLTCSWQIYMYQTKTGEIMFDAIEKVLSEAFIKEVGKTGPGENLSQAQAKKIVDNCKNEGGSTQGSKVVRVRNCILNRIKYLENL